MNKRVAALGEKLDWIVADAARRKPLSSGPAETSTGFVKREVYMLVRTWRIRRDDLRTALAELGHTPTRRSALINNPFHWVLRALKRRGLPIGDSEVRRIATELEYARRHRVPDELVVGFIDQTGAGRDIYRRVADPDHRESVMDSYEFNPKHHTTRK